MSKNTNDDEIPDSAVALSDMGSVVNIGGKDFAVGLFWRKLEDGQSIKTVARPYAKANKMDLMAIVPGGLQFGLIAKRCGARKGMPPLATMLAQKIDGNFLGVWPIAPGGPYYILAVNDDAILPNYEGLIQDRDDAVNQVHELLLGNWPTKFCPAEWNIPETNDMALADIIEGEKPEVVLKPATNTGKYIKYGLVGALVVAGIGGYIHYEQLQEEERLRLEEVARMEAARREAEEARKTAVVIPPNPWEGRMSFQDSLRACVSAMMAAPVSVPGWTATNLTCSESGAPGTKSSLGVRMTLRREGGTTNWIAPFLNREGFRPSIRPTNKTTVEVSWPVPGVDASPRYDAKSETGTVDAVNAYLTAQWEEMFHEVEVQPQRGSAVPITNPSGKRVQYYPYQFLAFTHKGSQNPLEYLKFYEPVPVTTLVGVSLELTGWSWKVDGATYEKLPPPPGAQGQRN